MKNAPKAVKTAKQNVNTALWTLLVQKRLDLKTASETNVFQRRSHIQCVTANIEKPIKPKAEAFMTRAAPIVAHHSRKYGLAPVAKIPETMELCLEGEGCTLSFLWVLSSRTPMHINIKPPAKPMVFWTIFEDKNAAKPKYMRNIKGNSTIPCPREIRNPAVLSSDPFAMVTANTGPGAITPDSDMKTTDIRNR